MYKCMCLSELEVILDKCNNNKGIMWKGIVGSFRLSTVPTPGHLFSYLTLRPLRRK